MFFIKIENLFLKKVFFTEFAQLEAFLKIVIHLILSGLKFKIISHLITQPTLSIYQHAEDSDDLPTFTFYDSPKPYLRYLVILLLESLRLP